MSDNPQTFPVSCGLLEPKHFAAMPGQSLFFYLWFVRKVTEDCPNGDGKFSGAVLGGKAIELSQIASELGTEYWTVRRYVGMLVAAGYLERSKTGKGSCSYIVTNSKKFAPARQRLIEPAKSKNGFDPIAVEFPDGLKLNPESWAEWTEHRKQKRNKLTPMAVTKQFKNLLEYQRQGHSAKDVIEHSIAQGYTGLFPPNSKVRPRSAPSPGGGLIENLRQQQIAAGIREAK